MGWIMALINKLTCLFNFDLIDEQYDIFQITTSGNYIDDGSYVLDKPTLNLKALSLVFDRGKSAYALFKKGSIDGHHLAEGLNDSKLSTKKIFSNEVKNYVLLRLFMFALSNYSTDENMFNNIGGRLFLTHPLWKSKNGKTIKALDINVSNELQINAKATTFKSFKVYKNKSKALSSLPKYIFLPNGKFRRVLNDDQSKDFYINRGFPGKKTEIPFLDLKIDQLRLNRAFYIMKTLDLMNSRFKDFLSVSLSSINVEKQVRNRRDTDFIDKSFECVSTHNIYLSRYIEPGAYDNEFETLKTQIENLLGKEINAFSNQDKNDMEIVFLHNEEYYQGKDDPYKNLSRDHVVQCVTLEDSVDKVISDNKAVINTIFKEMTIKDDILNKHQISLDDWKSFGFTSDWIFGDVVDGKKFFMIIHPDGSFEFERQIGILNRFKRPDVISLSKILDETNLKGKHIVMDDKGNVNIISRTDLFCMPNPELFKLQEVSRSKESRDKYLEGVVDINLFKDEKDYFYNAGIIGYGMNTGIPKANLLYKITVVKGENIIEKILETMAVMFVKYNNFTILPYPFKYLREYIKTLDK